MRRDTVRLLRCPRCQRGALRAEGDLAEILFGPLACAGCEARFPVSEGMVDLSPEHADPAGLAQRAFEHPLVARGYEQHLRPAVQRLVSLRGHDAESEYLIYRALLGSPSGPVLDLGCGTGLVARRLAREPGFPAVVALDLSRAMLEETLAQAREHGSPLDVLRAAAPALPFQDGSLGAVLHVGGLHFFPSLELLLREVRRVLCPGGRYVASTYLPPSLGPLRMLHAGMGLYPRGEAELRAALEGAGLVNVERLVLPPFILVKGEAPQVR
ncbi:MAG: hypothetical protein RL653_3160 [Pseudomonadota bacterium]